MSCSNSTVIAAPLDKVWATLRDFHSMDWAEGVIESCERIGDRRGDEVGARRKLNGAIIETLRSLDDDNHVLEYSIDEGPGPLADCKDYVGKVTLSSDAGQTRVQWTSSWGENGGGVKEFCDPIYQALLAALGKSLAQ